MLRKTLLACLQAVMFCALPASCAVPAETAVAGDPQKLSAFQLNLKLLEFSDNYQESISEAIDKIIAAGVEPTTRAIYQTIKVFYVHSAVSIATESDAVQQLLDMMVMVRLQRLVWEAGGHGLSTDEQARRMSRSVKRLEDNLHFIALQVFDQASIDAIMSLAEDWKRANPDREYVAFVRFQDFAASRSKARIEAKIRKGGLFASISDAKREIEQTRFAIERAMFLANRLPILLGWQSELYLYKTLSTREIADAVDASERLTLTAERLAALLETVPAELHKLLTESSKPLQRLTRDINESSANVASIVSDLKPLLEDSDSDGEVDIERVERIFELLLENTRGLVTVTENLNRFSYDSEAAKHLSGLVATGLGEIDTIIGRRLEDVDSRLLRHRERIFERVALLLAGFCVVFPVCFFAAYAFARRHTVRFQKRIDDDAA